MTERNVQPVLLGAFDYVWHRVRTRLGGLSQEEYLWEPTSGCWSVRQDEQGVWRADRDATEPDRPPLTTVAWRLWHIGSECLAGYTARGLGDNALEVEGDEWYGDVTGAVAAVEEAWLAFRGGCDALGEEGLWEPLGEEWGPYAEDPWAALILHAYDEVAHHGAEVALMRDLYTHRFNP